MSILCHCPCHEHPGTYSCEPCHVCGHYDSTGHIIGALGSGWAPNVIGGWDEKRNAAREVFLVEENVRLRAELERFTGTSGRNVYSEEYVNELAAQCTRYLAEVSRLRLSLASAAERFNRVADQYESEGRPLLAAIPREWAREAMA